MDVHLRTEAHQIAVRALLTIRNDGKTPLARHSAADFVVAELGAHPRARQGCRVSGGHAQFGLRPHRPTARGRGAAGSPLPPGESVQVDVTYSGTIASNAQRLLAIGTPQDVALRSDWDQIDTGFTGLRGFGNVVWYPVSSVPVILGDGARLFDEMGEHKLRLAGARFRLHLTVEFPHGHAPSVALINGHPAELSITDAAGPGNDIAGVATARCDDSVLGFEAPSLFVAVRKAHAGNESHRVGACRIMKSRCNRGRPRPQPLRRSCRDGWDNGRGPNSHCSICPIPRMRPMKPAALLATSLHEGPPEQLEGILAHALTHAWMQSPRAWLSEGVAHFMGTLWIEKQQGREKALSALEVGPRGARHG